MHLEKHILQGKFGNNPQLKKEAHEEIEEMEEEKMHKHLRKHHRTMAKHHLGIHKHHLLMTKALEGKKKKHE